MVGTAEPIRILGPGFLASRGERDVPFEIPRLVAHLALKLAGQGSTVDLVIDPRFGLLTSTSPAMRIEWLHGG